MALYLTRFSYTPETWARLTSKPEDRREAAKNYIESVGGKLHGFWYAFGEFDGYNLWEAPDNVSMASVLIAISGGGALSKTETTVLLTVEETLDALGRAGAVGYRAPGTGKSRFAVMLICIKWSGGIQLCLLSHKDSKSAKMLQTIFISEWFAATPCFPVFLLPAT